MERRIAQPPQIGDTLRVRPASRRLDAGAEGVVTRVRARGDGSWSAAELEVAGRRRWYLKGELEASPRPRPRLVAPPANFLRIARRHRRGRPAPALFLYVGRALLARWQEAAGPIARVDIDLVDGRLTICALPQGRYVLDAAPGRQPNIHCDGVRNLIMLPDGRYHAEVAGTALIVTGPLDHEVQQ